MSQDKLLDYISKVFKPHPWHGIKMETDREGEVHAFIEIVPTDTVKYEMDKESGYLKVDRPQKFSNIIPSLYGFVPQTYCWDKTAAYSNEKTGRTDLVGDGDALDICVLTEKAINHGDLILSAIPIGGFRMIDGDEADDKIIAILRDDPLYGAIKDIENCPQPVIDRLVHYFLTYKQIPGVSDKATCEITHIYGREEAWKVLKLSSEDYHDQHDYKSTLLGQ
ncbi:MAG: inorganic pyrophosphatase [SAR324 cluster bacterium]|uniref:inorganic diphosphatase n=1 Tax=SAR324 cluster bacterium TaxID=2024889 RepID=A0A2A4T1Z5_9DELT|nr:MAG: inorganic pyrophosphatase [SAR324 cluster bacterium]